jgi:FkbM family methyltransferase
MTVQSNPFARLDIQLKRQSYTFQIPNSIFMKNMVMSVFRGEDYPLIDFPADYSPAIILDIGANVGASAIYFHDVYPNAQIYCYEPSLSNFQCLHENTKDISTIHAFHCGLFDQNREMTLYHGRDQCAQNSVMDSRETSTSSEMIRLIKVSEELEKQAIQQVSILKVDTEGCEVPILRECLRSLAMLDVIYLEYHSEEDRCEIEDLLEQRFALFQAKATGAHRGTAIYISRDMLQRYSVLERRYMKIER